MSEESIRASMGELEGGKIIKQLRDAGLVKKRTISFYTTRFK
jgi:hypothetical protein